MDEMEDLSRLQALYRTAARETPSAAMDSAVLGAAAARVRRDRAVPMLAMAAGLLAAVLVVREATVAPTPGAAPETTRNYLLAMQSPPADPAGVAESVR
jgi:hypothetical protein